MDKVGRLIPRGSVILTLLLALALAMSGCNSESGTGDASEFRDDFDVRILLQPPAGEDRLPELEPPLSAEETRSLRDGFSWETSEELSETDASGRPSLYYALVYLQSRDDVELFEALQLHESGIPLFAEERERWRGKAGFFNFDGDGEGVFRFAIIPGRILNEMRRLALDGDEPFRAVVLRDAPTGYTSSDGSLSYEALGADGFVYGGGLEDATTPEQNAGDVGSQTQPIVGVIFRAFVNAAQEVVQGVREVTGELDEAVAGTALVRVSVRPLNTDPGFNMDPESLEPIWMRRAWGDDARDDLIPTFGAPMWIREAVIQAHKGASLNQARLAGWGIGVLEVPKGRQTLCLELSNPASEIIVRLTEITLCTFEGDEEVEFDQDFQSNTQVLMEVKDPRVNMFAQFLDGHDYMRLVVGRSPRQARVYVGRQADFIGLVNEQRAAAFCMGDLRSGLAFLLASVTPEIASIQSADIIFPGLHGDAANSRGVPTHEYGHHVLCDLMVSTNLLKFSEAWLNIFINTLTEAANPGPEDDALVTNEAFADFFTLQVLGATNYTTLPGAKSSGLLSFCPVAPSVCPSDNPGTPGVREDQCAPACGGGLPGCGQDCAEDNVGGADQDYVAGTTPKALFDQRIAKFTTLFHDAFDGMAEPVPDGRWIPSPGAAFNRIGGAPFGAPERGLTESVGEFGLRGDEPITLPGPAMRTFVEKLFDQWATLNASNVKNALALTVLAYGYTPNETCELFALHSASGDCTDELDPSVLSGGDITPGPVLDFRVETDPDSGDVTLSWQPNAVFATRYEVVLTPEEGTSRTGYRNHVDSARVSYPAEDLAGDTLYTATVTTLNGALRSESVEKDFVTFADPVQDVSAVPGRGSIDVSWTPPTSGRLQGYQLWQVEPEERLLAVTSDTSARVDGLSEVFSYRFAVRTVNQVDAAGPPVLSASVLPMPPRIVYVAVSGDDDAPDAGTEASPFAHVGPALERATATDADVIRILAGTYVEAGPLTIRSSLRIEGGYRDAGATWVQDGGLTRIEVAGVRDGLLSPKPRRFNLSGLPAQAALVVEEGLDVSLVELELAAANPGEQISAEHCTTVVYADASDLRLERVSIRMETEAPRGACAAALFSVEALGVRPNLGIYDSELVGYVPPDGRTLPAGLEAGGAVMSIGGSLIVEDSRLVGVHLPTNTSSTGSGLGAVGLAVSGADDIRIRRSDLLAVDLPRDLHWSLSGTLNGAFLRTDGSVFIDNSVFRTPTGGSTNNALELESRSGGADSARLVHVTAIAGSDWHLGTNPILPFEGSALRVTGAFDVFHVVNSIFSFAAGCVDFEGSRCSGIDLSERTELPTELGFHGNIISIPGKDWLPEAESALVYCRLSTDGDLGNLYTETDIAGPWGFGCGVSVPPTTRWTADENQAFTEAPDPARSDLGMLKKWCGAFGIDGKPDGYPTRAPAVLWSFPFESSGVALGDLPFFVTSGADHELRARDRTVREPAGAFLPIP